jgi:hypothetical protein
VLEHHKGEAEVHLVLGAARLRAGEDYRVKPSSVLQRELDLVLDAAALAA